MKNKKNIIIISILVLILIGSIVTLYIYAKNSQSNRFKKYYANMEKQMTKDYNWLYDNIDLPSDASSSVVVVTLGDLKRAGFSMDNYVSFENKKACNPAMSYAERRVVNGKEEIKVFYSCDEDKNY